MGRSVLPAGVVTFLLTDPDALPAGEPEAAEVVREAVARHGGVVLSARGDGAAIVGAFDAAASAPRITLHTEEVEPGDAASYGAAPIAYAERLRTAAPREHVLLSGATAGLVRERLPSGAWLRVLDASAERVAPAQPVYALCHASLAESAEAATTPPRGAMSGVPQWPTPLIGRERERRDLGALLARTRFLTVVGVGGSGKTRLAQAVVTDVAGRWREGVVWIDLARLAAGAPVIGAIAAGCGVVQVPGLELQTLIDHHLTRAELLLVLDNCEHVLPACAAFADQLQAAASSVTVLATSREPLHVAGEVTWRIPSLSMPEEAATDRAVIASNDAVRLFVARAREARPDLVLDAAAHRIVAGVCRRLDGIPLALELAAARLRSLSLRQLADGLDDRFRVLTGRRRAALSRQRTLRGSVEWSHELLAADEQVLFRRLGVFAAPFSLDAAEAVADGAGLDRLAILDLLANLVEKSLVQLVGERYRLLETLRQYALERAEAAGELASLRARHLEWFCHRAARWRLDREVATAAVDAEIAQEAPDLVMAFGAALTNGAPVPTGLLFALAARWRARYASADVRAAWAELAAVLPPRSDAWLAALAPFAVDLALAAEFGWVADARAALDAPGADIDPTVRGFVELGASFGSAYCGLPAGLAGFQRALADGRRSGSLALEVEAATHVVIILMAIGDCARMRPLLAWLDRHLPPDARLRHQHRVNTGMMALFVGDLAQARPLLAPGDGQWDAMSVTAAALVGFYLGDAALITRAIGIGERLRPPSALDGDGAWMRAMLLRVNGDLRGAAHELEAALEQGVLLIAEPTLRFALAENHWVRGDDAAAVALLERLEAEAVLTELHYVQTQVLLLRAAMLRRAGNRVAAEQRAHAAIALARAFELNLPLVEGLEALALLAAETGREPEAARLLGAADEFRRAKGFRLRQFERDGEVDALRARLAATDLEAGARLSLGDAVDYARRGRGERGRPPTGWESLTPSESRVAELIAQGLPNREIAAALFVSVSTVKTHLLHVFAKLEVRTRADLAAKVARRGG